MRRVKFHIPSLIIAVLFNLSLHPKSSLQDVYLPTHLTPEKYKLIIFSAIFSESPKFWGDVLITVKCNDDTDQITVHKKDLDIDKDKVKVNLEGSKSKFIVTNPKYDPDSDQYTLTLHTHLQKGNRYEIFIPFEGQFSSDSTGYFLFTRPYQTGSSIQNRIFAITRLGISDARRVFPCFDEMEMKAKFTIVLAHPKTVISFSNMEIAESETVPTDETWIMDRFAESIAIPPSAVAIALIPADFEPKKLNSDSEGALQIWAEKSDIRLPKFKSETMTKAFGFNADYFTVPFAFPKLNVILYVNLETNGDDKYGVIIVGKSCMIDLWNPSIGVGRFQKTLGACHAMNHQWIDPYAVMSRKNENWFHEALILHYDVLCVNKVSPSYRHTSSDMYIAETFLFALKNDQDGSIDKLLVPENDPHMKKKLVDPDHLRKGHFLLRMLNFVLGEKVFQLGINVYFSEFALKNSNLDQVWASFSQEAVKSKVELQGLTIETIMNSWLTQKGCPLLIVKVEREKNRVTIEQKRFKLLDELNEKRLRPKQGPECWNIPLSYMKKGELESETVKVRKWITCDGPAMIDISLNKDEWIVVNLDLNVLSRTSYEPENWDLLLNTLNSEEYQTINVMTRVKLISDAFELSKVELLPYNMLFDIINYLNYEIHCLPWKVASQELENIRLLLFETEVLDQYEAHIKTILKPVFDEIYNTRFDFPKGDLKNEFKRIVFEMSCDFGFQACQELCTIFFNEWSESVEPDKYNPIPRYIRDIVYCQVLKTGNEKEWKFLWSQYNKEARDVVNDTILEVLGCSSNRQILEKYLKLSLDETKVLPSDSVKIFRSLSKNKIGYKIMKDFLIQNFEAISSLNSEVDVFVDPYFMTLFDSTKTDEDLNDLLKLATDNKMEFEDFDKIYNHHVSVAIRNILWLKKYKLKLLMGFLKSLSELSS